MSSKVSITSLLAVLALSSCSRPSAQDVLPNPPIVAAPQKLPLTNPSPPDRNEGEGEVTIVGPSAIGFFPPITQQEEDEDDGGLSEGYAHLGFALEDLEKCLAPRKIAAQIKITRSLQVKNGPNSHTYEFPSDWQHAIGVVLATPGHDPVVIYATGGPSSLIEVAPQEAWKYFAEPNCKRYGE